MDDQDPAQPVRVHRRSSPPTSRSQFSEFEFRKRTSVKLIRFPFVRNQASVRESKKKKKKKKTQVDFSRGVRSQPSNYAVYAPAEAWLEVHWRLAMTRMLKCHLRIS